MQIKQLVVGLLATNCYLIFSNNQGAIIDPGEEPEKILKEVEKNNLSIKYIINTHLHFDHVSANQKIKEKTNAQILRNLTNNQEIKIGQIVLKVIDTPGHSKESVCLVGDNFIFTGDTLFKDGYGRTDLPGGSDQEMKESLNKLSKIIKPGMIVYPGHGEIFKN
jgi:hydroxyacylglutathione hydrolase